LHTDKNTAVVSGGSFLIIKVFAGKLPAGQPVYTVKKEIPAAEIKVPNAKIRPSCVVKGGV
jgi:hypothetical protein